jgi:putative DNA primase/helicase
MTRDPEIAANAVRDAIANAEVIDFDPLASVRDVLPEFSDEALALDFSARYARELRYVAAWSRWLAWTGTKWRVDDTLSVFDRARTVCREAATRSTKRNAAEVASARTVAAIERLARADRRHAATAEIWDSDAWVLNTPGGVVDLRTGILRAHRNDDYNTKIAAASPGGECPTWMKFLDRITSGERSLQDYLQRLAGYALTGSIREHSFVFLHGTGANGKSVFIGTLAGLLGDYARTAPIETFTAAFGERHPTELAMLRGARLVTAVETEEGRRWAESKIKMLTGGDKIAARFMRGDFFEFEPTFKLLIAGNHRPSLRSVDEAIRRRLHMVPFTVTIPEDERDEELPAKLRAEWPGILAWAIDGCGDWLADGLRPPEAVIAATAAYLDAEDAVAAWIEAECEGEPDNDAVWTSSTTLFESWSRWASKAGERPGTVRRLVHKLEARGYEPKRKKDGRGVCGLALRQRSLDGG